MEKLKGAMSVVVDGEIATVYDFRNRFLFVCDREDICKIEPYKFYKTSGGYSQANINRKSVFAHRIIIDAPCDKQVDHISRDRTDNRKANLRLCTSQENKFNSCLRSDNTSGIKGVRLDKSRNKWYAYIKINRKLLNLGRFDINKLDEAINARKTAELLYFGDFAAGVL